VHADPRPSPDVISQELDGEVVLVHLQTNRIFALNQTGARFWQLLESGHDRARIREALASEFDVEHELLEREMEGLVDALAAEGLVTYAGE
jgi:hypothetical protein